MVSLKCKSQLYFIAAIFWLEGDAMRELANQHQAFASGYYSFKFRRVIFGFRSVIDLRLKRSSVVLDGQKQLAGLNIYPQENSVSGFIAVSVQDYVCNHLFQAKMQGVASFIFDAVTVGNGVDPRPCPTQFFQTAVEFEDFMVRSGGKVHSNIQCENPGELALELSQQPVAFCERRAGEQRFWAAILLALGAQKCESGCQVVEDGDDLVDTAALEYLFNHRDWRKNHDLAAATANNLGRHNQRTKTHRAQKRDTAEIHEEMIGTAPNHIHAKVDFGCADDVEFPLQMNPSDISFNDFAGELHP